MPVGKNRSTDERSLPSPSQSSTLGPAAHSTIASPIWAHWSSKACSGLPPESSSVTFPAPPACTETMLVSPAIASSTTSPFESCMTVAAPAAPATVSGTHSAVATAIP